MEGGVWGEFYHKRHGKQEWIQNQKKAQKQKVFFFFKETKSKKKIFEKENSEERFLRRVQMSFFKPGKALAENKNNKFFGVSQHLPP